MLLWLFLPSHLVAKGLAWLMWSTVAMALPMDKKWAWLVWVLQCVMPMRWCCEQCEEHPVFTYISTGVPASTSTYTPSRSFSHTGHGSQAGTDGSCGWRSAKECRSRVCARSLVLFLLSPFSWAVFAEKSLQRFLLLTKNLDDPIIRVLLLGDPVPRIL